MKQKSVEMQPSEKEENKNPLSERDRHLALEYTGGGIFESIPIYIAFQAFFQGLFSLNSLTLFMYQKDILKMGPAKIQFVSGILALPFCIKPVVGYLIDRFITRYSCHSPLFILSAFMQAVILSLLAHVEFHQTQFFFLYFLFVCCAVVQNIISEYILCVYTQRQSQLCGTSKNEFPIFFGFRALGSLVGSFFGGRLIKHGSLHAVFYISSFIPVFTMTAALLHKEMQVTNSNSYRTISQELGVIIRLISQKQLVYLILALALMNICPSFESMTNYFFMEELKFTTEDMADISTASTVAYIIGLIFYYKFLIDYPPARLFLSSNFLLLIANITFLAVVCDVLQKLDVNIKFFCILNSGFYSFIGELNSMPVMTIWTSYTPPGLEATSVTLLTGISNLTSNISNYTGSFVLYVCEIDAQDLKKVWLALIIQNLYLVVVTCIVYIIPLSNSKPAGKPISEITALEVSKPLPYLTTQV